MRLPRRKGPTAAPWDTDILTRRIARLLAERSHAVIDWRDLEQESELHALMGRKSVTGPMQDYIRREARQQLGHTRITPRITQNLRPSATGFHNPENAITARIDVTRLLARLTPGQSRVLILYDLYGYTQ